MLNTSAWKPFPRYRAEPEVEETTESGVTPYEHDPILRYAIVGIFVMLVTPALYQTKVIALPITAGIILAFWIKVWDWPLHGLCSGVPVKVDLLVRREPA